MKTYFAFISIILFTGFQELCGQSNGLRIGAHVGAGEARISKAGITNQTGKLCLQGGLAASYQFNSFLALSNNILITRKGSRASGVRRVSGIFGTMEYSYEEDISLHYIEIPVFLKASVGIGSFHLKAFAGPGLNLNLKGRHDLVFENQSYNEDHGFVNREIQGLSLVEYSLLLGVGVDIELSDESIIYFEIRQNSAFNSFGQINGQDAYNNYFTVGAGFLFSY